MNKKNKFPIKYIFLGILIIFTLILVIFCIIKFVEYKLRPGYINSQYEDLVYTIKEVYEFKPSFFEFDENGVAIVTIDNLLIPITNGNKTMQAISFTFINEHQDECVGYIIVEKSNNDLKVDTSHICDMIDY